MLDVLEEGAVLEGRDHNEGVETTDQEDMQQVDRNKRHYEGRVRFLGNVFKGCPAANVKVSL